MNLQANLQISAVTET